MFKLLEGVAKAAVAVAVTPITVVADTVMLIPDSCEINKPAFSRTGKMLSSAMENLENAVDSDKE